MPKLNFKLSMSNSNFKFLDNAFFPKFMKVDKNLGE